MFPDGKAARGAPEPRYVTPKEQEWTYGWKGCPQVGRGKRPVTLMWLVNIFWAPRESFRLELGPIVRSESTSGSRRNKKRKTDRREPKHSAVANREGLRVNGGANAPKRGLRQRAKKNRRESERKLMPKTGWQSGFKDGHFLGKQRRTGRPPKKIAIVERGKKTLRTGRRYIQEMFRPFGIRYVRKFLMGEGTGEAKTRKELQDTRGRFRGLVSNLGREMRYRRAETTHRDFFF